MNLYRSFGNLMETWVNEAITSPQLLQNNTLDALGPTSDALGPTSDMGINPRSESVDSGVELASCGTPCQVSSSSASTETDSPMLQSEGLPPALSQSPVLSSPVPSSCSSLSSPCLCSSAAEEESSALHLKVERALRKAVSRNWKSIDESAVQQPRASFLPKRHASELVRCPRSQSFDTKRRFDPSVPLKQMSEVEQCILSADEQKSKGLDVKGKKLSPGLFYLEQVCQMLEKVAREQMHSQAFQMETNALWEREETEVPETCQTDSTAVEEDQSCSQPIESAAAEQDSNRPQQQKNRHFRQRSASDTTFASLNLKKLNANHRGQLLSTNDLLESVEEDRRTVEETTQEKSNKAARNWRVKLGALKRTESAVSDTKSQQMQSTVKNSTRRRLSQMFRRNKENKDQLV